jgi:hypothetical protein
MFEASTGEGMMFGLDGSMRFVCFLFLAFMPAILPAEESPRAIGRCDSIQVSSALREIASEKPGEHRFLKADALAARLYDLGSACVTDADVALMSSLMRDEDDSLRFAVAGMIGNLGHAGRAAIPALERALADRPCEDKTMTSASAIRAALWKLGVKQSWVKPPTCRNPVVELP